MEIQTLDIDTINPAIYNPRKDLQPGDAEYEKLKKSILEFDMVETLVWNKRTGNLVGGHQRLKILKELGIATVEVSVVDLTPVKEKALNIALNKIEGEWDYPRLKDLLQELDTGEFDMEITGFDLKEIEDLMAQFHVPGEGLTEDDAVPEATESKSKRGDLWSLGNHRLLCGDATVNADVERLMGGEKADMVFTDPPYGVDVVQGGTVGASGETHFGTVGGGKIAKVHRYAKVKGDDTTQTAEDAYNLCVSLGVKNLIYWGGNYFTDFLPPSPCWLVWNKKNTGNFADVEIAWTNFKTGSKLYEHLWNGLSREGSRKDELKSRVHPTQKPVGLFVQILQDFEGDIVLDLFGGSGSTLIACEKLDRRCYMMEIDEHYCDVIIKRWEDFTGKEAVRIDG